MKTFHDFRLDSVNRCLWRGSTRAALTPKGLDLLQYLVEHRDRLISQEEILEALWARSYVNPEIIKKYILGIRKVLGDRPEQPIYIETVPKRGYRFIAPVREEITVAEPANDTDQLVGRSALLDQLGEALQRSDAGHRQIMLLAGEAGAGKSALADYFAKRATERYSTRVARGHCLESLGSKEDYYPLLEAVGQLARPASSSVWQVLIKQAPTWAIQFPGLLSEKQRDSLQRNVLGATSERMLREICEALEQLAASVPLLLVLEDLHWSDTSTLDFLSAFARRRGPARVMVLATYRPDETGGTAPRLRSVRGDLLLHARGRELAVERLSTSDIARYLASKVTRPAPELIDFVESYSRGNALFMVAIVHDLLERGLVHETAQGWQLAETRGGFPMDVPRTLQQLLKLQLDQASALERGILHAASAAGMRFSAWELATATQLDTEVIEDACEALSDRRRFIRFVGMDELPNGVVSAQFEFLHALYRESLYRDTSPVLRSKLHRGIAERLESLYSAQTADLARVLAGHFEEGRNYRQAIRYLLIAAQSAAARFAHRESIELYERAIDLLRRLTPDERTPLELELLERVGDVHYAIGAMPESLDAYEKQSILAERSGLAHQHAHALMCQAVPLGLIDPDRAVAVMERASRVSDGTADAALALRARFMTAVWRLLYGSWNEEDAASFATLAVETQRAALTEHDEMFCLYVRCLRGEAAAAARLASDRMPRVHTLMGYLGAAGVAMLALLFLGHLGNALQIIRDARSVAQKNGHDPWLFVFREAWLHVLAFDFAGAGRLCETIEAGHPVLAVQPLTIARFANGYFQLDEGRYDDALRSFQQICDAQATPKFFLHWYWRLQSRLALTELWLARGHTAKAQSEVAELLRGTLCIAEPTLRAKALETAARVAVLSGDMERARQYVADGLRIVEQHQVPLAAWQVHTTASDVYLRGGASAAAENHWKRAQEHAKLLADSLSVDSGLRSAFLAADRIRRLEH